MNPVSKQCKVLDQRCGQTVSSAGKQKISIKQKQKLVNVDILSNRLIVIPVRPLNRSVQDV